VPLAPAAAGVAAPGRADRSCVVFDDDLRIAEDARPGFLRRVSSCSLSSLDDGLSPLLELDVVLPQSFVEDLARKRCQPDDEMIRPKLDADQRDLDLMTGSGAVVVVADSEPVSNLLRK
jgi:hypothetical protein